MKKIIDHEDQFLTDKEFWSVLVPELLVKDISKSEIFYCDLLGFSKKFKRPEDRFLYIELGHAQLMLEQESDDCWKTAELEAPLGRGINFQIEVADVRKILSALENEKYVLYRPLKTNWYRENEVENGQLEFLVQDPDGYLLRFIQHIGQRDLDVKNE